MAEPPMNTARPRPPAPPTLPPGDPFGPGQWLEHPGYPVGGLVPGPGANRVSAFTLVGVALAVVLLLVIRPWRFQNSGDDSQGSPYGGYGPTSGYNAPAYPQDTAGDTTSASSDPGSGVAPATTVQDYYDDVNASDFESAWQLGGSNLGESYADFAASLSGEYSVTVDSDDGETVVAQIVDSQSDGTQITYQGSFTVAGGVITAAALQQTG